MVLVGGGCGGAAGAHTCKSDEVCVKVCELYLVFTGTWTVIAR